VNTIIASFRVIEGKEAEADEAIAKQAAAVEANEPGTLAYVFHRHAKDPALITVFEVYKDDDASNAHRGSEHMAAFGKLFGTIFDPGSVKIERHDRVGGFIR
jgi:quinol monooxygenase YgiN